MNMQRIVVRFFQRIVEKVGLNLHTFNLFQNLKKGKFWKGKKEKYSKKKQV